MPQLYSLSELAEMFTKSIGGDDERQELMVRQIRNLATQQLIKATEIRGGRRTVYLGMREAAKARIQIAMINLGLDALAIRDVSQLWEQGERAVDPRLGHPVIGGSYPPRGLDAVLYDLSNGGPDWSFIVHIRFIVETGERFVVGGFVRADQPELPEEHPLSLKGMNADGVRTSEGTVRTEGSLLIPATQLIRTLFED
ncbi:hypothetical protein [Sinorhizobium fredii]|uniref:Uncharacterized protein n=1 Tax=Rhizobium fredii TaxID=380 RepID=A0A844A7Q6_RHIFR|nr:hypothetical protein [Sinorhizobium fredii]MQX09214.1 hypothetical protein [Sinorhizobium fredii]GEC30660.1 hypothetical protein EFR01_08310 [Sinorhizobium fredii]GLS06595.1 hypothetical protein GCM10007864_02200 [Sinorhizobium fredii]